MSETIRIENVELRKPGRKIYALCDASGEELGELHENTIIKFLIRAGSEFTFQEWQKIVAYDEYEAALEQAYRYLQRRQHLENELRRKLFQKRYSAEICGRVIETLREKGYLHDAEFIVSFIKDQLLTKRSGPLRIKSKLLEKGASMEHVDDSLATLYSREQQLENARFLLSKKAQGPATITIDEKQKLVRHLQNRGFTWNVIEQALYEEKLETE